MIDYGLNGRTAVVTGASSGIGRATARLFAEQGCRVALIGRRGEALAAVKEEIQALGAEAEAFVCDVGVDAQVESTAAKVLARFGKVDALANVAGIEMDFSRAAGMGSLGMGPDPFDIPREEWDRVMNTNVRGHFNTMKYFTPSMRAQRFGRVVNVTSVTAFSVGVGSAVYVASKAAANTMVYLYAKKLGPDGITVNAIAPGFVDTPMHQGTPEEAKKMIPEVTPLRRVCQPEDVARVVLFFSQEHLFVTGQVLIVDGGTFCR